MTDELPHQSQRELAIIRKPQFGVGDRGMVALWFSVYTSESSAALQVFHNLEEIGELIEAYGVRDVHELDGKPCWVKTSPGLIEWAGPWRG